MTFRTQNLSRQSKRSIVHPLSSILTLSHTQLTLSFHCSCSFFFYSHSLPGEGVVRGQAFLPPPPPICPSSLVLVWPPYSHQAPDPTSTQWVVVLRPTHNNIQPLTVTSWIVCPYHLPISQHIPCFDSTLFIYDLVIYYILFILVFSPPYLLCFPFVFFIHLSCFHCLCTFLCVCMYTWACVRHVSVFVLVCMCVCLCLVNCPCLCACVVCVVNCHVGPVCVSGRCPSHQSIWLPQQSEGRKKEKQRRLKSRKSRRGRWERRRERDAQRIQICYSQTHSYIKRHICTIFDRLEWEPCRLLTKFNFVE